ncbi:SMI1/KNR4 family protein [Streptomyces bicolor]|uniref:SMI1/KNR4 family protein n=1 Tax=Streptomyces bicolor TaxID=66874 RepID=UPI000AB8C202|nr:SMI1/KNR4 family protein [Streptomyces bicolor]
MGVDQALGQALPDDLAELLRECNGVTHRGMDVIWPAEQIAADNAAFRTSRDFADLYMPFEPLMFFGCNGGGDQFAFIRTPARDEVFVWDHETDSRYLATYSLEQYLHRALREASDWYR